MGNYRVINALSVHFEGARQVSRPRSGFVVESHTCVLHRKADQILKLIFLFLHPPPPHLIPPLNWVREFHIFVVVVTLPAQK